MFSSLESSTEGRRRRGITIASSFLGEGLLIGLALFLIVLFPEEMPLAIPHYARITVAWLNLDEKPAPKPQRTPPRRPAPEIVTPRIPALFAPPVARLEPPKLPSVTAPEPPTPVTPAPPATPPKEPLVVRTGIFGGETELARLKLPASAVQTGGFGSPQGLPGQAQGGSHGNVPKLGSFDLPEGPGVGNGTGGAHGRRGIVASAGFGSGVAGNGVRHGGAGVGRVAAGDFDKKIAVAPSAPVPPVSAAEFQPVEILFKPSPVYTDEARRLGIQGEVALSVVFQADGTIKLVGVVKSLGHGLDQAAEQAALRIRFKPARRSGQPADFPAVLRIEFRVAGQVTPTEGSS